MLESAAVGAEDAESKDELDHEEGEDSPPPRGPLGSSRDGNAALVPTPPKTPPKTPSRSTQRRSRRAYSPQEASSDKTSVGTASYICPVTSPQKTTRPTSRVPGALPGVYRAEQWRESGTPRWPLKAEYHAMRQPHQFARAEEVLPLQRSTENPQNGLSGELWMRSLRVGTLSRDHIAKNNTNVASVSFSDTFDRHGTGWSGTTNSQKLSRTPPMSDWVERPVAVGSLSLDHMGGSRYEIRSSPRECVPGSMRYSNKRGVSLPSASSRNGALTAR